MKKEEVEVNFVHLCDYFSFGENGKINILGGFKSINGPIMPITIAQMFIVTNITVKKAGTYKEVIKLYKDEVLSDIMKPLEFTVMAKESNSEIGTFGQLNALSFNEGIYKFKIFIDGELIKEIPFSVNKIAL